MIADFEAEIDGLRDSAEVPQDRHGWESRDGDWYCPAAHQLFWFSASALVIGIAAVLGSVALVGSDVELRTDDQQMAGAFKR